MSGECSLQESLAREGAGPLWAGLLTLAPPAKKRP